MKGDLIKSSYNFQTIKNWACMLLKVCKCNETKVNGLNPEELVHVGDGRSSRLA